MEIIIEGMSCKHCVKRVENALKQAGAINLSVSINNVKMDNFDKETAKQIIEDLGFDVLKIVE